MLNNILTTAFLVSLIAGAIRVTTPILLAALGELVTERSGIMNLSIEGTMVLGAFIGFVVTYHAGSLWLGLIAAIIAGGMLAALFGVLVVNLKIDQTISGLTINMFASGFAFYLYRIVFSEIGAGNLPNISIFTPISIPLFSDIPISGKAFFNHSALAYIAFLMVPVLTFFIYKTRLGLELRALGENPRALDMKGINVIKYQFLAIIFGGMMSGAAGSFLTLASSGMFVPNIASGRGWIAFAIVIFGNWKPVNIMFAALFFGFLDSFQMQVQGIGIQFPYQILLALPYVLTIIVLMSGKRKSGEPLSLGVPYYRE